MIKLIIFDVDGTLVDACKAIEKSLYFTLNKLGYPLVSPPKVRRAVGWGDRIFISRFIKKEEIKKGLKIYQNHHKRALLKYSKVISGAKRVIISLKKRNYILAIVSNRPQKFTNILLNHLKLKKYFSLVLCAKNKKELKPNPKLLVKIIKKLKIEPEQAFYVGDMAIDVYAGRNAGIKTIAVSGGFSTKKELRQAKPFKVISKIPDLLNFFSSNS